MEGTDGFTIKTTDRAYHTRNCKLPAMLIKFSLKEQVQFKSLFALKNPCPSRWMEMKEFFRCKTRFESVKQGLQRFAHPYINTHWIQLSLAVELRESVGLKKAIELMRTSDHCIGRV